MGNQTIVSKENILELLVELGIMPEDIYQELIESKKVREIFAINAIGLLGVQKIRPTPIDLETILTASTATSLRIIEVLGKE